MSVTDLENLLTQVWNPDTRPLAEEAWRCYNSGAIRASIAAIWTAITADIITKLIQLADDGESGAVTFRTEVANAQKKSISQDGVRAMQNIEASLLDKAAEFELIDSIGQRELQRIREDRNLCVHPSLRSFSEVYEPRPEVARGHLAVALTTLLIHPSTQGGKVLDALMVSSSYARERLPVLEQRFAALPQLHRMKVVAIRPHPYFVPVVLKFIEEAGSWRTGEQAGQLLVQHSPFLNTAPPRPCPGEGLR